MPSHPSLHNISGIPLDKNIYNKLSIRYIIALICIALAIITSQLLIQNFLKLQLNDSSVVNVAGRQRMLSQQITKLSLLVLHCNENSERKEHLQQLKSSFELWTLSHYGLINGNTDMMLPGENSDSVKTMFANLTPYFNGMSIATQELIDQATLRPNNSNAIINEKVHDILINESKFLPIMDAIVNQYDNEAVEKVRNVIHIESLLMLIALSILVFEFFFIFHPTATLIKKTIHSLLQSEAKEKQSYKNIIKVKSEEQKFRSSLIFEGQERERRRLSRDLHDGIGQMLTGLKFQIEALTGKKDDIGRESVEMLKEIISDVIKEVRRVSFNLRPTVLSDYGLSSGIRNIVKELDVYTEANLSFSNKSNFNMRLDKKVETHLYRITQEAINNALKYSKSNKIEIKLWHNTEVIGISIKDYGVGFNLSEKENKDLKAESGHGIFNMKERASFINAELRIKTAHGKGTEIIVYLPLN